MNHVIQSVIIKKKVKLVFEDGLEINISHDNYLRSQYLFPGKILFDETLQEIISYESDEPFRNYLRGVLKKGSYSIYQLMVRLIERKKLAPKDARRIVGDLEREGRVDDRKFTEIKIDLLRLRGFSPDAIKSYLRIQAKVADDILKEFDEVIQELDEDIVHELILKGLNKKKDAPVRHRIDCAKKLLMRKGYDYSSACQLVDEYLIKNEESLKQDDFASLRKPGLELIRSEARKKNYSPVKMKIIILGKLRLKGYPNDIAEELYEEYIKECEPCDALNLEAARVYKRYIERSILAPKKKKELFYKQMRKAGYSSSEIVEAIEEANYEFN